MFLDARLPPLTPGKSESVPKEENIADIKQFWSSSGEVRRMQGVKKLARSGSLIVEELFGIKTSNKQELDPAEVAYASAFNGKLR